MKDNTGIIIETISLGGYLKVTAIDSATGVEGSIVADPKSSKAHQEKLAIQRLEYIIKKNQPDTVKSHQYDEKI